MGASPEDTDEDAWGVTVIGNDVTIGEKSIVPANVQVAENVKEGTTYESK